MNKNNNEQCKHTPQFNLTNETILHIKDPKVEEEFAALIAKVIKKDQLEKINNYIKNKRSK